ncbi:MAG: hypothetical protein LBR28_03850 [Bacteroidales bacterium]|jgi:negative regulator of sigma E activity|nr:hypothetical protein [Bacteroidales bacterium]
MTKKLLFLAVAAFCTLAFTSCGSQKDIATMQQQSAAKRIGNYKQISKKIQKEGFEIVGLNTLDNAVYQHLVSLSGGGKEVIGMAEGFKSENVGRQVAKNNAIIDYATTESNTIRGKITSNTFFEGVPATEFDKFYAAYQRHIQINLDGVLTESFSVISRNKKDGANRYRIYFIADDEKAKSMRLRALERAVVETKTAQEYATEIEKFINEE